MSPSSPRTIVMRKQSARIFVEDQEITSGLLDYDVDLSHPFGFPIVTLKIFPRMLTINGELGEVIKYDLLKARRWPWRWRCRVRHAVRHSLRALRRAGYGLRDLWREAHPANDF